MTTAIDPLHITFLGNTHFLRMENWQWTPDQFTLHCELTLRADRFSIEKFRARIKRSDLAIALGRILTLYRDLDGEAVLPLRGDSEGHLSVAAKSSGHVVFRCKLEKRSEPVQHVELGFESDQTELLKMIDSINSLLAVANI